MKFLKCAGISLFLLTIIYNVLWISGNFITTRQAIVKFIYGSPLKFYHNSIRIIVNEKYEVLGVDKNNWYLFLKYGYIPMMNPNSEGTYNLMLYDQASLASINVIDNEKLKNLSINCLQNCFYSKVDFKNHKNIDKYEIEKIKTNYFYFPNLKIYLSAPSSLDINNIDVDFLKTNSKNIMPMTR